MKLARYFVVGGIAAVIDFCIFALLVKGLGVPWFIAVTMSFTFATLANYVLSIRHVFESRVRFSKLHEIVLVFVASLVGLLCNYLVLLVLVEYARIDPLPAKIFGTAVAFLWNYAARSGFIFRRIG